MYGEPLYALRMPGIPSCQGDQGRGGRICQENYDKPGYIAGSDWSTDWEHNTDIDYNKRSNQFENQTAQLSSTLDLTESFLLSLSGGGEGGDSE